MARLFKKLAEFVKFSCTNECLCYVHLSLYNLNLSTLFSRLKKSSDGSSSSSMYQRLSAHLNSVDLPQLDFKEISRGVETAFSKEGVAQSDSGSGAATSAASDNNSV